MWKVFKVFSGSMRSVTDSFLNMTFYLPVQSPVTRLVGLLPYAASTGEYGTHLFVRMVRQVTFKTFCILAYLSRQLAKYIAFIYGSSSIKCELWRSFLDSHLPQSHILYLNSPTALTACLIYCLVYFADKPRALHCKTISE